MEDIGSFLKQLRGKMTYREASEKSGLSHSYIRYLEIGKRPGTNAPIKPTPDTLKSLSIAYNYDYQKLMEMAGYMNHVEKEFKLLPDATPYDPTNMIKLPILGTVRAGEPIIMNEHIEGYEYVEPDVLRGRPGFVLRVKGDSMTGDYIFEGDKVIVVTDEDFAPSDIVVVAINGYDATLKRVKQQEGICILISSNTAYEPMIYPVSEVHIIGKVVQVRRNL